MPIGWPRSASLPDQQALWAGLRHETFLIVGAAGLTGLAAARLLRAHQVRFRLSDSKPPSELWPLVAGLELCEADLCCGEQHPGQLEGITSVILSPGVPRSIPLLVEAQRRGLPILGDLDFLYPFIQHKPIVAITGTDGKTTTTQLTAHLLARQGSVVVAGNIGVPLLARYAEILARDVLVLEVSSFMLEALCRFRPTQSTILNIAEDHVDRYETMAAYAAVKQGIVRYCDETDGFIKNLDDPRLRSFSPHPVQVRTVSAVGEADYRYRRGQFEIDGAAVRYQDCRLHGRSNIENILAAAAIARSLGVDATEVTRAIPTFPGVPHRFQYLGRRRGVRVYNDSKATTVHAVLGALRSFERGVVLIVGGREKGLDFSPLGTCAAQIKHLVCYGEAGEAIRAHCGVPTAGYAYDFEDAVLTAVDRCVPGDVLLLSPGCTSWDQFPNYEARGFAFEELVRARLGTADDAG